MFLALAILTAPAHAAWGVTDFGSSVVVMGSTTADQLLIWEDEGQVAIYDEDYSQIYLGSASSISVYAMGGGDSITADTDTVEIFADLDTGDDSFEQQGSAPVRVYGDSGADEIVGGSGDDELYGGDDEDLIEGEDGEDYIEGGDDADEIYGGDQGDEIHGGSGGDYIEGGWGGDYIRGNDGADTIYAGKGNDEIYGNSGKDKLAGEDGSDDCYGGKGSDKYSRCEWMQ